ncbi:hypothetical protein F5148DRAFT_1150331 [Russula earlei]|uniref:Uncharacterized protein n=1 Tax=Russula earlei TaxID=71964 RepID=A0ACC0U4N3_9AGAM|nr:hypothetical protein F5148DRAFT_1150331 [Russula earlei]
MPVMIGTIGQAAWIEQLTLNQRAAVDSIKGKWEAFMIATVKQPAPGIKQALCIIGSNERATAFGVFELSRLIGVHPFYWWADIQPEHQNALYIAPCNKVYGSPSVKYRGIFLNDEDWGLHPWAAAKMDTAVKDIGPHTYQHIFELLLRLKANYLWPAMHPCTKAFYYYKEDGKLAADYDIIIGTSHCEPMMRNNVFEWADNYQNEYGHKPGEWRYDLNKDQIYQYWEDRIKQVKDYPTVVTVGMRGIHDGSMPGPKDMPGKVQLLGQVIKDQRDILTKYEGKPANEVPQIFCPYKEVLNVYNAGLQLPDDITIVWSDDNHGYIRQLPDGKEQQRSGGSGIYYHLSYWGRPQDFLWLSTVSPSLISYEMSKAYAYQAGRLWVFNVGDLKPAEEEIQFSMDLAWNVQQWQPANAYSYTQHWAVEIFGKALAEPIAAVKNKYYELAASGKPEHIGKISYTDAEAMQRVKEYDAIAAEAETILQRVPVRLKEAYYELVLYPVKGAALMNKKVFFARKSIELAQQGKEAALGYASKAKEAFEGIEFMTDFYNKQIGHGKWDGIMSSHPRDQEIFKMPVIATEAMVQQYKDSARSAQGLQESLVLSLSAADYTSKTNTPNARLETIEGLGVGGKGLTIMPLNAAPVPDNDILHAPAIQYKLPLATGNYKLRIQCLPTHDLYKDALVKYAVAVNGNAPQWVSVEIPADTAPWDKNVLNGYVQKEISFTVNSNETLVNLYLPTPGVVVNRLEVIRAAKTID